MILSQIHIINKKHSFYKECDKVSFLSKNLYNSCLYLYRQMYFEDKKLMSFNDLYYKIRRTEDYQALPDKVSKQVLKQVDLDFRNFFKAIKEFKVNPKKFTGRPSLPNYKDKFEGRNKVTYYYEAINKRNYNKTGCYTLSKTSIEVSTNIEFDKILEIRIIPKLDSYQIEVIYEVEEPPLKTEGIYCGIDLGVDNLTTLTFSDGQRPIIYCGMKLKSINRLYNKEVGHLKSELPEGVYSSKKIREVTNKRNYRVNNILHKVSREITNQLVSRGVKKLCVGKNDLWKQDVNLKEKTNQNFVQIPHSMLIEILRYKCKMVGIEVETINEAYTSKCSFIDDEDIKYHTVYKGKRIKRGMFISSDGTKINSDVNGSYNILRKCKVEIKYTVGVVSVNPIRLKVY